ncbi:hypothetical protein D3C72_2224740 [compost metagenome]
MPGQVGQGLAQGCRALVGTTAPLVAADPFVTGQPQQCHASRLARRCGQDLLMPAQRRVSFIRVDAALP